MNNINISGILFLTGACDEKYNEQLHNIQTLTLNCYLYVDISPFFRKKILSTSLSASQMDWAR